MPGDDKTALQWELIRVKHVRTTQAQKDHWWAAHAQSTQHSPSSLAPGRTAPLLSQGSLPVHLRVGPPTPPTRGGRGAPGAQCLMLGGDFGGIFKHSLWTLLYPLIFSHEKMHFSVFSLFFPLPPSIFLTKQSCCLQIPAVSIDSLLGLLDPSRPPHNEGEGSPSPARTCSSVTQPDQAPHFQISSKVLVSCPHPAGSTSFTPACAAALSRSNPRETPVRWYQAPG